MIELFLAHNLHQKSIPTFELEDPHLKKLRNIPLVHTFHVMKEIPTRIEGIFTVSGNRQIGKSTLLKQWMLHLMKEKDVSPANITYLTGEVIDGHHQLITLLEKIIASAKEDEFKYIILDEVNYIKDWDKGVKFLADSGNLLSCALILTGSDKIIIEDALKRFPGRRGKSEKVDFQLFPLNFAQTRRLKGKKNTLEEDFFQYCIHGGFLTAINDFVSNGKISISTYTTYFQWIIGDILKQNKQEEYLKDLVSGIIKHYGSQISWNSLARELRIEHHKTVADYLNNLVSMDAVFIQEALKEDKLTASPKKAKKVYFTDPFIFHAVNYWINQERAEDTMQSPEILATLVESIVVTHFRRKYPTYYIKGTSGEVDIAYIENKKFWPVEVKWTTQVRPHEIKQLRKYTHSVLLVKNKSIKADGIKTLYLLEFLEKFDC